MSATLELAELAPPIPAPGRQSHEGIARADSERTQTPQSTEGNTSSPPETPSDVSAIEPLAESTHLRQLRMFAAFIALFLAGWNNGATGALIPTIERTYGITYARVSMLFVCTFLGYIGAAIGTGALARRIGFGNALCVSVFVELIGVGEVLVVVITFRSADSCGRMSSTAPSRLNLAS